MASASGFVPNWNLPPPSETIDYLLCCKGISLEELASSAKLPLARVEKIMQGNLAIDHDIAAKLAEYLGGSRGFWLTRDQQYRESLQVLSQKSLSQFFAEILPIRDMTKFGWLNAFRKDDTELDAAIRFFGVRNVEEFLNKYSTLSECLSFRRSGSFALKVGPLAAWIRAAEIEAESIRCKEWSVDRLSAEISHIRTLTRERDPAVFVPKLAKICREAGVVVSVVRAPRGCPVSGATTFLSTEKALVVLSFRHLTDDHFWFSLFHELGHLILHERDQTFIESSELPQNIKEVEANDFAASTIVPIEKRELLSQLKANKYEIVRFANSIGISPGLVVGQLQHLGILRRNQLNFLKRKFLWSS